MIVTGMTVAVRHHRVMGAIMMTRRGRRWRGQDDAVSAMSVVVFAVADHRFALPLGCVAEAVEVEAGTSTGDTWRHAGRELRVISAAEALGLTDAEVDAGRGLVLDAAEGQAVFVVERILGVTEIDRAAVVETPAYFSGLTAALVAGLVPHGDRMIVLLRPEVLDTERIRRKDA